MSKSKTLGLLLIAQIFLISLFGISLNKNSFRADNKKLSKDKPKVLVPNEKTPLIPKKDEENRKLENTKENSVILTFKPSAPNEKIQIFTYVVGEAGVQETNCEISIYNERGSWDVLEYNNIYTPSNNDTFKIKFKFNEELRTLTSLFEYFPQLIEVDLSNLITSEVTELTNVFSNCKILSSINLKNFDSSKVTDMYRMFNELPSLTTVDVSGLNTSLVTNMMEMFKNLPLLTSINLSGFNTSSVTNMGYMFTDLNSLKSLDVSGFNTSSVISMEGMFRGLSSLTSLDVSGFNTSSVIYMCYMFLGLNSLTSLDIRNFDLKLVNPLDMYFYETLSLRYLYLPNDWNQSARDLFGRTESLFSGRIKKGNLNIGSIISTDDITWNDKGCEIGFVYGEGGLCNTKGIILDTNIKINIYNNKKFEYRLGYLVGKADKTYTFEHTLVLDSDGEKKGKCSIQGQIENEEIICNYEPKQEGRVIPKEYYLYPKEEKIEVEENGLVLWILEDKFVELPPMECTEGYELNYLEGCEEEIEHKEEDDDEDGDSSSFSDGYYYIISLISTLSLLSLL